MIKKLIIWVVLVILALPQSVGAIVGGEQVSSTYSWSVAFVVPPNGDSLGNRIRCSGVLINKYWILTAAHCWEYIKNTNAVIGRKDLYSLDGEKHYVTETDFRRGFGASLADHDVMMVKIDGSNQTPIKLSDSSHAAYWNPGDTVRYYGYGRTSASNTGPGSTILKRASQTITTFSPTGPYADDYNLNAPYGMALSGIDGYSAGGDSGGPVITSTPDGPRVVGIISGGHTGDPENIIAAKVGYRSSGSNSPLYLDVYEVINN